MNTPRPGCAGGVPSATQAPFHSIYSILTPALFCARKADSKKIRGAIIRFGLVYMQATMPSLHLAGLLEAALSITVRSDSLKLTATYRSPSLGALHTVQQAFGGIAHRHPKAHPFIKLNATSVYKVAETLFLLNTPYRGLYDLVLHLRAHKASYDNTRAAKDEAYRVAYGVRLDGLAAQIRAFSAVETLDSPTYISGLKDARKREQDPAAEAMLTWARPQAQIIQTHQTQRATKIKARLEAREHTRAAREAERLAAIAERKAKREARWAAARAKREIDKAVAKQRRVENKAAKHRQRAKDIACGVRCCGHCHQTLPLDQFHLNVRHRDGYAPYCKRCSYERYHVPNRDKVRKRVKEWYAANPEKARAAQKREHAKPSNRLRGMIRNRIKQALDRKLPSNAHIDYLGCSIPDLRAYIETLWSSGMTWETYGPGTHQWCIDHIVPYVVFSHTDEQHLRWCWSYRNLRPLWNRENSAKSDLVAGTSVRQFRASGREAELNDLVGAELERLGITTKTTYLASLSPVAATS